MGFRFRRSLSIIPGVRLGRVDKSNPDANAREQHEGRKALDKFVIAGGDPA